MKKNKNTIQLNISSTDKNSELIEKLEKILLKKIKVLPNYFPLKHKNPIK